MALSLALRPVKGVDRAAQVQRDDIPGLVEFDLDQMQIRTISFQRVATGGVAQRRLQPSSAAIHLKPPSVPR
jgi:hypothetical protein